MDTYQRLGNNINSSLLSNKVIIVKQTSIISLHNKNEDKRLHDNINSQACVKIGLQIYVSQQAANISILVNKLLDDGIKINILTIHDAFATNANYIDELTFRIKLAFLVLYADKDFILKFHDDIVKNLISQGFLINEKRTHFIISDNKGDLVKIKIPKPFEGGAFNLKNELPLSKYFMH